MDKKNFTLPRVSKCKTFISFNYFNPETLSNKRFKKYVSRHTPPEMWNEALRNLLDEWTIKLKNGYDPFKEQKNEQNKLAIYYVPVAIKEACTEHIKYLRLKTAQTYTSKIDIFTEWLIKNHYSHTYVADFIKEDALKFINHLSDTKGRAVSPTTRNAYLITLRTLWSKMIDSNIAKSNPFQEIDKIKENRLGRLPFKSTMKRQLMADFHKEDKELWLYVQFIYYCFIRPGELRLLKVGAIDLEDEKILVDADISKNRKNQYVAIPKPFLKVLREIEITKYKHSYYIFSPGGTPGQEPYSKDVFNRRHKVFREKRGYNYRYSLYSWKHTGARDAAQAGINVKQLQLQLRHADLQTTDIYLKSLGIKDMDDIKDNFPSL